jgi:hypothetical protein
MPPLKVRFLKGKTGVIILLLALIVVLAAGMKTRVDPARMSLFSVSKVDIDPTGGGEFIDGRLEGAYWLVNVVVDHADSLTGNRLVILEEGESGSFQGDRVETRKVLEVRITPYQAFFYRGIREEPTTVTEDAYKTVWYTATAQAGYRTDVHEPALTSHHYVWDEAFWRAETRFKVEAWLDGVRITPYGGKVMDTHAGETSLVLDTSYGPITFRSLGSMQGGWEDPDDGALLIWNENYIYDYDRAIPRVLYDSGGSLVDWKGADSKVQELTGHDNPYSVYWFGEMRWSEKAHVTENPEVRRTPAGLQRTPGNPSILTPVDVNRYGGWTAEDDMLTSRRLPVKPVIFPEEKTGLPSEKQGFYCLTEWLRYECDVPNKGRLGEAADRVFRGYDSWEVDLEDKQVRVYMPWNAYEVPVIQVLVPSELVDTWVWTPPVADLKIVDWGWLSSDSNHVDISPGGTRTCWIVVRQDALEEATGRVDASTSLTDASVHPSFKQPTLEPGETAKLYFEVTNLGVASERSGKLQFTCSEMLTGEQTDSNDRLTFTLKPSGGGGDTVLDVTCVDSETGDPVGGIHVYVYYGGSNAEGMTDERGFTSFNFGSYTGKATLSTSESGEYRKAVRSVELRTGTQEKVLQLVRAPKPAFPWGYIIIGFALVAALALCYYRKRQKTRA